MLPDLQISDVLRKKINREYLDFLISTLVTCVDNVSDIDLQWFLQEVLLSIQAIWPNLSKKQYSDIMNSMVDIVVSNNKKLREGG
jgi:hypothetical protein